MIGLQLHHYQNPYTDPYTKSLPMLAQSHQILEVKTCLLASLAAGYGNFSLAVGCLLCWLPPLLLMNGPLVLLVLCVLLLLLWLKEAALPFPNLGLPSTETSVSLALPTLLIYSPQQSDCWLHI